MIALLRPTRSLEVLSFALLAVLVLVRLAQAQVQQVVLQKRSPGVAGSHDREVRRGVDPTNPNSAIDQVKTQSMRITIVDAATEKPIIGAEILAPYSGSKGGQQPQRLADENGRFVLQIPLPSEDQWSRSAHFSVTAQHPDFAPRAVAWTASGGDVFAGLPPEVVIKLQPGISIGGKVVDARGAPIGGVKVLLNGSGYRGYTIGGSEQRFHEYPEIIRLDSADPAAVTGNQGRWTFDRFPADLAWINLTLIRPDESRAQFTTAAETPGINRYPTVNLSDLIAKTATLPMPDGLTVRGFVADENGRPLAGVKVSEGYGHGNIVRV
jgi:hypothetical protein